MNRIFIIILLLNSVHCTIDKKSVQFEVLLRYLKFESKVLQLDYDSLVEKLNDDNDIIETISNLNEVIERNSSFSLQFTNYEIEKVTNINYSDREKKILLMIIVIQKFKKIRERLSLCYNNQSPIEVSILGNRRQSDLNDSSVFVFGASHFVLNENKKSQIIALCKDMNNNTIDTFTMFSESRIYIPSNYDIENFKFYLHVKNEDSIEPRVYPVKWVNF